MCGKILVRARKIQLLIRRCREDVVVRLGSISIVSHDRVFTPGANGRRQRDRRRIGAREIGDGTREVPQLFGDGTRLQRKHLSRRRALVDEILRRGAIYGCPLRFGRIVSHREP